MKAPYLEPPVRDGGLFSLSRQSGALCIASAIGAGLPLATGGMEFISMTAVNSALTKQGNET